MASTGQGRQGITQTNSVHGLKSEAETLSANFNVLHGGKSVRVAMAA